MSAGRFPLLPTVNLPFPKVNPFPRFWRISTWGTEPVHFLHQESLCSSRCGEERGKKTSSSCLWTYQACIKISAVSYVYISYASASKTFSALLPSGTIEKAKLNELLKHAAVALSYTQNPVHAHGPIESPTIRPYSPR